MRRRRGTDETTIAEKNQDALAGKAPWFVDPLGAGLSGSS